MRPRRDALISIATLWFWTYSIRFSVSAECAASSTITVESADEAENLRDELLSCVGGGIFDVLWKGSIKIKQTIVLQRGITLYLTGTNGGVIDGEGGVQLFRVANATLHLENVQLVGGLGADGGAVYAPEGAMVVVSTCTFSMNSAWNGAGGAIYGGPITSVIIGGTSLFEHNHAERFGGAVSMTLGEDLSIDGVTDFINNTAGSSGGAIYVETQVGDVAFGDSVEFSNNTAGSNGGAISIAKYNALILDGLLMSGNRAQRGAGGALYCLSCSRMAIVDVSFLSNSAVWGGAMAIFSSNGTISGSVFQRNSASDGGALFAAPGSLGIEMSDFVRNVAWESGGAISHSGLDSITSTSFVSNGAGDEGYAILSLGPLYNASGLTFVNNSQYCNAGSYGYEKTEDVTGCRLDAVCARCALDCNATSSSDSDATLSTSSVVHIARPRAIPHCEAVPVGSRSSPNGGTTLETLVLEEGYYRTSSKSHEVLECYRQEACVGGVDPVTYCRTGYTGPYCANCDAEYAAGYQFSCNSCIGDRRTLALAWMMLAVCVILLLLVVLIAELTAVVDLERSTVTDASVGATGSTVYACISRALPITAIKIVVVTWQILTQFVELTGVEYPSDYAKFLAGLDVINFDVGLIFSLGCFVRFDFLDKLVLTTVGPVLALGFLGLTFAVACWRNRSVAGAVLKVQRKHVTIATFLLFIVYSPISYNIFRTFSCEQLDDEVWYLRADYDIECESTRHKAFRVYAGLMIVLYPVGIPAAFALWFYRNRRYLADVSYRSMAHLQPFRNLWEPFKPGVFWYELVDYLRRSMLTGIAVFIYHGSSAQVAIILLLAFVFLLLFEILAPFQQWSDSLLYRLGTIIVFISMYLALLLKVDVSDENSHSQEVFAGLLIMGHVVLLVAIVIQATLSVTEPWRRDGVRGAIASSDCPARRPATVASADMPALEEAEWGDPAVPFRGGQQPLALT